MLADLPGLRAEEPPTTPLIPNEILVTTARPDIVAITNPNNRPCRTYHPMQFTRMPHQRQAAQAPEAISGA